MLTLNEHQGHSREEVEAELYSYFGNSEDLRAATDEISIEAIKEFLSKSDILIADTLYGSYSGHSYYLFYNRAEKKFYELSGSHCSCYQFEGQWNPYESNLVYLLSVNYNQKTDCQEYIKSLSFCPACNSKFSSKEELLVHLDFEMETNNFKMEV